MAPARPVSPTSDSDLDGAVVDADIVDAQEDALAVLLLVRGSDVALKDNEECHTIQMHSITYNKITARPLRSTRNVALLLVNILSVDFKLYTGYS